MFALILTLVGTLLHLYCAWRAGSLPWIRRRVGVRRWWLFAFVAWLAYVVGIGIGDHPVGPIATLLAQFAFHWLGVLFLLAICLLAVDLVTSGGRLWARRTPLLRAGALALGALLVVIALIQGHRAPVVTRHELMLADLPAALDGTTLVAMSDLHLGTALGADWLAARVAQVRALAPDLIVLIGDLTEGEPPRASGFAEALRGLQAPLGVWAVTGNHEFHGDTLATIALFESAGVRWLRDRAIVVQPGLRLAGVDDLTRRARNGTADPALLEDLAGAGGEAAVLLSHSPLHVEAAAQAGFDLMLSGHTHGGQIWPFGYLVRQRYPYFLGHYRVGAMHLLVGRGTGTWGPRMRLWRPGEILQVTLRAGK